MDSITSILLSIVAAMIFAAGGWLGKNALLRFRLRHIHYLLEGSDKIKVIFPTFFSPSFADGAYVLPRARASPAKPAGRASPQAWTHSAGLPVRRSAHARGGFAHRGDAGTSRP